MLRLIVENREQSEANVAVRWCVTPGTLQVLKSKQIEYPFLFLTVARGDTEVHRALVPLEAAMEYIQLHHAGEHTIYGYIVWPKEGESVARLQGHLLRRESASRYSQYLYRGGKPATEDLDYYIGGRLEEAQIGVTVGPEFFAPEPWAWEKTWVNLWYEFPAQDQCQFRRRRMVAYTIQPPLMLAYIMALCFIRGAYALAGLIWGNRGVKLAPIFHPFRNDTQEVFPGVGDGEDFFLLHNWFLTRREGTGRRDNYRAPGVIALLLLFHPIFLALVGTGAYFATRFHVWALVGRVAWIVCSFAAALACIIFIVVVATNHLTKKWNAGKAERARSAQAAKEAAEKAYLLALREQQELAFQDVICNGQPLKAVVAALPARRQTVRLRFLAFKAKVCRPFARTS